MNPQPSRPHTLPVFYALLLFAFASEAPGQTQATQWLPLEITLEAEQQHPWWEFPVEATFTHSKTRTELPIKAFFNGERNYTLRFAPPLPGEWRYLTHSSDRSLNGQTGVIRAQRPTADRIAENANLRGHLKISDNGRYFEYSDGTPFFLLGDTNWAINTARCGLGNDKDGPFYTYLKDRKAKGFSTILMAYMRGFGDTNEPAGQRNEGGYPFVDGDVSELNAAYFQALDTRMNAIWKNGLAVAVHPTWFGKLNCFFDLESAKRISAYLAVRYGAFNGLWSLSGEYQYAMKDCGWTAEQIAELGAVIQKHNPYRHPLSIHPSGRTNWAAPHGSQSSKAFHDASWLDHHWLQTGQQATSQFNVAVRSLENYRLSPVKPVFLSESYYERALDPDQAYHTRWQAWTALLNGAAGYGYGAFGMWQFYDPEDAEHETGKKVDDVVHWQKALKFEGSQQLLPAHKLLTSLPWWQFLPDRDSLTIDEKANPLPTRSDLAPPHCARAADGTTVTYIPRGNAGRHLRLTKLPVRNYEAYWFDPRTGNQVTLDAISSLLPSGNIPQRPDPANEDWVFVTTPVVALATNDKNVNRIKPFETNPRYWQCKGKPVLLLGGSKTDHLFLLDDLESHLDEMQEVGANYVRNTMSQREGAKLKPHKRLPDGKFDLNQWNEQYWTRFQNMLKWTAERDIIVQIEVWDRFDYATQFWESSPWNPKNNTNYSDDQSGFAKNYVNEQLYEDAHSFFHTVPSTVHYNGASADLIRRHQERFVDKMLSYSLPYGNVLYCMNNETSSEVKWGQYWMTFIRNQAEQAGVTVHCTDMFDDVWSPKNSAKLRQAFDNPKIYSFLDVSQVNSRSYNEDHWDNIVWIAQQREAHLRPLNHTKIYGSGYYTFGTGGPEDGVERFWRNLLAGSASSRFHRPDHGNGLSDFAKSSIKAARILETRIKFWEITPQMGLLSHRAINEAYLAAKPGESYALYFTNGGSVGIDLSDAPGPFEVTWISVSMGVEVQSSATGGYRLMDKTIEGGGVVKISAPYKGGWVAAIVKQ